MTHSADVHLLDGTAEAQSVVITEVVVAVKAPATEVMSTAGKVRVVIAKARMCLQKPRPCKYRYKIA